jgi:hypothetical protein
MFKLQDNRRNIFSPAQRDSAHLPSDSIIQMLLNMPHISNAVTF